MATVSKPALVPSKDVETKEVDMSRSKPSISDKTLVPNYIIVFFLGILITLIGFAITVIRSDIAEVKDHTESNKIRYQQLREKLIEHGWRFKDDGTVIAPMDNPPQADRRSRK